MPHPLVTAVFVVIIVLIICWLVWWLRQPEHKEVLYTQEKIWSDDIYIKNIPLSEVIAECEKKSHQILSLYLEDQREILYIQNIVMPLLISSRIDDDDLYITINRDQIIISKNNNVSCNLEKISETELCVVYKIPDTNDYHILPSDFVLKSRLDEMQIMSIVEEHMSDRNTSYNMKNIVYHDLLSAVQFGIRRIPY